MAARDRRLDHLEDCLWRLGEGVLTLGELDGYVAGLLAAPRHLPFETWTPFIFDPEGGGGAPSEAAKEDVEEALAAAARHYNSIADTFRRRPGRYEPVFEVDEDGALLWEPWTAGFALAVRLQSAEWTAALDGGGVPAEAAAILNAFIAIAEDRPPPLSQGDLEDFVAAAGDLIPEAVERLYVAHHGAPGAAAPASVGRNDPCPCGSLRKFKKCCGAATA